MVTQIYCTLNTYFQIQCSLKQFSHKLDSNNNSHLSYIRTTDGLTREKLAFDWMWEENKQHIPLRIYN